MLNGIRFHHRLVGTMKQVYIMNELRSYFLNVLLHLLMLLLHALLLLAQDDPVVLVVVLVAVALEEVLEHVAHDGIRGSLVEPQVAALAEVLHELHGVALAEHLDGRGQLLLLDALVLVALVVGLEPLPRQHPPQEVHRHIADALHVVAASCIGKELPCSMPR
jgi:hypothetical protein